MGGCLSCCAEARAKAPARRQPLRRCPEEHPASKRTEGDGLGRLVHRKKPQARADAAIGTLFSGSFARRQQFDDGRRFVN